LIVSDSASTNVGADVSGPTIYNIVIARDGYEVSGEHRAVVPDDKEKIACVVGEWCGSGRVDWVITTGGTGFGVRDVTPEVRFIYIQCYIWMKQENEGHITLD